MQSTDQFNGVWVSDCQGRRIGRVVGADPGDALFTVDWLVVRVRWSGRRAVPADSVAATMTGLHAHLSRTDVLASPPLAASWLDTPTGRAGIADYYAQLSMLVAP